MQHRKNIKAIDRMNVESVQETQTPDVTVVNAWKNQDQLKILREHFQQQQSPADDRKPSETSNPSAVQAKESTAKMDKQKDSSSEIKWHTDIARYMLNTVKQNNIIYQNNCFTITFPEAILCLENPNSKQKIDNVKREQFIHQCVQRLNADFSDKLTASYDKNRIIITPKGQISFSPNKAVNKLFNAFKLPVVEKPQKAKLKTTAPAKQTEKAATQIVVAPPAESQEVVVPPAETQTCASPTIILPNPVPLKKINFNENEQRAFTIANQTEGFYVLVGGRLKDKIRSQNNLSLIPPPKSAFVSYPSVDKDIDIAGFTKNKSFAGFDLNEHKNYLYNLNKEALKFVGTHVDLAAYHSFNVTENMLDRDFLHASVCANFTTGQVYDPTGRGIQAILDNRLATVKPALDSFAQDPIRILRAVKCVLEGMQPDVDLLAGLSKWQRTANFDPRNLIPTLRKHLLAIDNYQYINKLQQYDLLDRLFGQLIPNIKLLKPHQIRQLLLDQCKISLTKEASVFLNPSNLPNPIIVEKFQIDNATLTGWLQDNQNNIYQITNNNGSLVVNARDLQGNAYPVNRIFIQSDKIDKVAELAPTFIGDRKIAINSRDAYSQVGEQWYLKSNKGFLFPMDIFNRPIAKDEKGLYKIMPHYFYTEQTNTRFFNNSPTSKQTKPVVDPNTANRWAT